MELRIAGQADSHPAAYHRLRPADRAAVGRTSQARGACRRADSRAGATDSGRTDEPPRPRDDRMARGLPLPLADEPADGHARPLLSGSRMHRYRRARRPHDLLLQGQLQPLSGKAATAARRGGRPTRARREPLSQGARLDATATAGTRHESPFADRVVPRARRAAAQAPGERKRPPRHESNLYR